MYGLIYNIWHLLSIENHIYNIVDVQDTILVIEVNLRAILKFINFY